MVSPATEAPSDIKMPGPGAAASAPTPASRRPEKFASGYILVQPNPGLSREEFDKVLKPHGAKAEGRIGSLDVYAVSLPPTASEQAVANALAKHPHVKFAEVDALVPPELVPNDTYYGSEWHLQMVNAPTAWDFSQGSGVTVAIIDSGVDAAHPDLAGRLVPGWNFWDNNSNSADVFGHGTKVAGVVAAIGNNAAGVAGVAWNAKLMPVRVTDSSGWGLLSAIASGLSYAADRGARVANISFANIHSSSTVVSAAQQFRNKGGVVVNGAGNYGTLDSTPPNDALVSVSASDGADGLAGWSSYGPFVDLAAPGVGIWTTVLGGSYGAVSGTSFASPVVAGVTALVMAANPKLSPTQVVSILKSTAYDVGPPGNDQYYGAGRVNAGAAVMAAAQASSADTQPPSVTIAAPTGGTVGGVVPVSVTANDNIGVVKVALFVNDALLASDTAAPYTFSWDSAALAGSGAQIVARAYDAAGNYADSQTVAVTVSGPSGAGPDTTPPAVSITSPTGGTVSGVVTVNVSASDDVGVTRVDLMLNGALHSSRTAAPYTFAWDTSASTSSTSTLSARAYDAAGNLGNSSDVAVSLASGVTPAAPDTTPPVVTVTNPAEGATVNGMVMIGARATDDVGVKGITLSIDGAVVATGNSASISYKWNSRKASSGSHIISATARDGVGNQTTTTVTVKR